MGKKYKNEYDYFDISPEEQMKMTNDMNAVALGEKSIDDVDNGIYDEILGDPIEDLFNLIDNAVINGSITTDLVKVNMNDNVAVVQETLMVTPAINLVVEKDDICETPEAGDDIKRGIKFNYNSDANVLTCSDIYKSLSVDLNGFDTIDDSFVSEDELLEVIRAFISNFYPTAILSKAWFKEVITDKITGYDEYKFYFYEKDDFIFAYYIDSDSYDELGKFYDAAYNMNLGRKPFKAMLEMSDNEGFSYRKCLSDTSSPVMICKDNDVEAFIELILNDSDTIKDSTDDKSYEISDVITDLLPMDYGTVISQKYSDVVTVVSREISTETTTIETTVVVNGDDIMENKELSPAAEAIMMSEEYPDLDEDDDDDILFPEDDDDDIDDEFIIKPIIK